jgi:hypothetical protein
MTSFSALRRQCPLGSKNQRLGDGSTAKESEASGFFYVMRTAGNPRCCHPRPGGGGCCQDPNPRTPTPQSQGPKRHLRVAPHGKGRRWWSLGCAWHKNPLLTITKCDGREFRHFSMLGCPGRPVHTYCTRIRTVLLSQKRRDKMKICMGDEHPAPSTKAPASTLTTSATNKSTKATESLCTVHERVILALKRVTRSSGLPQTCE